MCSWCWGFRPTWQKLKSKLESKIPILYLLGGLAPDSDQPMPESMQTNIQNTWKQIQRSIPGTQFNFDFWSKCQPRRSTYMSCRAVIAAKKQNIHLEEDMILAIQTAYYLKAKNPSNEETLIDCAGSIQLDIDQFADDLNSIETQQALNKEIHLSEEIGAIGYPSLILSTPADCYLIDLDYNNEKTMLSQILSLTDTNIS